MASISWSAITKEYERIIQPLKDAPPRAATWVLIPTLLPFEWSGCVSQDHPLGSRAETTEICPLRNHLAKEP